MSDTQETDDFVEHLNGNTIPFDTCFRQVGIFARKLERERNQWRECAEKLAAVLRDADVLVTNATDDGRRDWHGDIGWLRGQQTAIIIDRPPEEELTEFDRLKEGSK